MHHDSSTNVLTRRAFAISTALPILSPLLLSLPAYASPSTESPISPSAPDLVLNPARTTNFLAVSTSLTSVPFLAAVVCGFFQAYGVTLPEPFPLFQGGSTKVVKALMSGSGDFATTGAAPLLDAINAGAPVQIISQMETQVTKLVLNKRTVDRLAKELHVTPDSPLEERVKALKGLKISTTPAGNQFYIVLQMLLDHFGMSAKDLVLLPALTSTVAQGVVAEQVDGAFWGAGALYQVIANGGAEWINLMRDKLPGVSDFPMTYIFTTTDIVEKEPKLVHAVVQATRDAVRFTLDHPNQSLDKIRTKWYPSVTAKDWKTMTTDVTKALVPDQAIDETTFTRTVSQLKKVTGKPYENLTFKRAVAPIAQKNG